MSTMQSPPKSSSPQSSPQSLSQSSSLPHIRPQPPAPNLPRHSQSFPAAPRRPNRTRISLVAVMIVSLLCAGAFRQWASDAQHAHSVIGEGGGAPLSRMNSFAMGLLLGGLRGPLVMLLWTSSESQKRDKDLDDFDTKVEWIRLLQPEFDTVHIFQIWNKAYNISVLRASLANKYLTILDALDYAEKVDRERPDDINILYEMGRVYFDKLGQSQEKLYYTGRVRAETQQHKPKQKLSPDDPAWRPLELNPMVDAKGFLDPKLLAPTRTALVDPVYPDETYDGSELQYLAKYQPFPDGISPLALGFNYQRRAAMLQSLANEKHAQLSDSVVDSRAPLTLEFWASEELERGRRQELAAFAEPVATERLDIEPAKQGPATVGDAAQRAAIQHAQSEYDLTARLDADSFGEYERHVLRYRSNFGTTESHMQGVEAQKFLASADRDYLAGLLATGDDRKKLFQAAAVAYRSAADSYELILYTHYLSDQNAAQIFPAGYNRSNIMSLDPNNYDRILEAFKRVTFLPNQSTEFSEDASEFVGYISRAQSRIIQIQSQLPSASQKP